MQSLLTARATPTARGASTETARTNDGGPRAVGRGLRAMGNTPWAAGHGLWALAGPWAMVPQRSPIGRALPLVTVSCLYPESLVRLQCQLTLVN